MAVSTSILLPSPTLSPKQNSLSISFFSASSIPLALPPLIARGFGWPKWGFGVAGVNERVGGWLLRMFSGKARETHLRARFMTSGTVNDQVAVEMRRVQELDGPRIRGWAYMDFYEDPASGVVPLLVECNFRGRSLGDEGWI